MIERGLNSFYSIRILVFCTNFSSGCLISKQNRFEIYQKQSFIWQTHLCENFELKYDRALPYFPLKKNTNICDYHQIFKTAISRTNLIGLEAGNTYSHSLSSRNTKRHSSSCIAFKCLTGLIALFCFL